MKISELNAKLKKRLDRKKKQKEHLEIICEATGWSKDKALEELAKAKELGMPNFRYVNNECWKMNAEEIKALNEKIEKRLERKQKKAGYLATICDATGWDMDKAKAELTKAQALGMPSYRYVNNACWNMSEDEMEELNRKIEKRLEKKRKYIDTICKATGWTADVAEEKLKNAKDSGVSYSKYVKEKLWKKDSAAIAKKSATDIKYYTQFTLKEVCEILGIDVPDSCKAIENDILTNLTYTPNFLRKDGGIFIRVIDIAEAKTKVDKAIREEAKVVFINGTEEEFPRLKEIPYVYCEDPFVAVTQIAAEIRKRLQVKVVGLTGSLGKTTTKDLIYNVLSQNHVAKKSLGNQNTIYPMFENLQKMAPGTEFFVQEFGAATPGVMPRTVQGCIPNAGVITNISDPHMDKFGSKENILNEKLKMITAMPKGCPAFFNYDNEYLKNVVLEDYPIVSFAVENKEADYYVENIQNFNEYMTFDIVSKDGRQEVALYSVGIHNIYNAVAAYAVGKWFGLSEKELADGIAAYKGYGIRQNLTNIGGYNLYIDCYNNAPLSLVGAVKTLEQLSVAEGGRRIAVIGDMSLLGKREKELHIETAEKISDAKIDMIFCYGEENAKLMADVLKESNIKTYYTNDRKVLNEWISNEMKKEDVLLFKGPVVRLLSKSIDQIFGTNLHLNSESYDDLTVDDFRLRVIWEKYHEERKTVALLKYLGNDKSVTITGTHDGVGLFSVGPKSFMSNETIEEAVISEPITNIGTAAFKGCKKLKNVVLPDSLINIEQAAFRGCTSLTSVVIPENVIEIGKNAFRGCTGLRRIVIPDSVGKIGENAFTGCRHVEFVCAEGSFAEEFLNKGK